MTFAKPYRSFVFRPGVGTRQLAAQVADEAPAAQVVVAETEEDALREIADAWPPSGPLRRRCCGRPGWPGSRRRRAPPAGYYFPELIAHPAVVTNLRGIFNDRIPAHIMSYVLSFARGLHIYARQQRESLWRPHGEASVVYLPGPPPSSSASATSGRRRPASAPPSDAGAGGGRASPGPAARVTALHLRRPRLASCRRPTSSS